MSDEGAPGYPYQEVSQALLADIGAGRYQAGDKLPSVRELARTHNVTPATAARAIRVLAESGAITTVPGLGIFVATRVPDDQPQGRGDIAAQLDKLDTALTQLAERVTRLEAQQ
jgi:GntR family transcriptional regulator